MRSHIRPGHCFGSTTAGNGWGFFIEFSMARLTADQWETIRAEREAGKSFPELAKKHGVSHQAIQKRAKNEGWGDGADIGVTVRRKVAEKVAGVVAGCNPKKKAEALENAAQKGVEIVRRHQRDWDEHHKQFTVAGVANNFDTGKSAKICAEMLAIRQKAERAAYGLEETPSVELPAELHIKLVSANGQAL